MKPRKFDDEHEKIRMHIINVLPPNYRFESMQYLSDKIIDEDDETQVEDGQIDGIPGTEIVLL